jgi:hypothetical protein
LRRKSWFFVTSSTCCGANRRSEWPKLIEEPVARYGPIGMNTQAELQRALAELSDGTFIIKGALSWIFCAADYPH